VITQFHLYFIGIPLLCIVLPSLVTVWRQRSDDDSNQIQMFFVWLVAHAMLVAACGAFATLLVFLSYGGIPGTASDGGLINGQYCFNWHDETYTQVSQQTWERAWFLEKLSQHFVWVPLGVIGTSFAILIVTRPLFPSVESNNKETDC